jgi:predicted amidohydrolase
MLRRSAWLAVGQMRATNDVEANLRQCAQLVHQASLRRCSLLCLPEGDHPPPPYSKKR